mmetsp:Transcript_8770/g.20083  ORF Transcript_8770/g.20083 Transcript_8770/m.20083 type:complete len:216 (-) Transcript_8770:1923-2570(-)
MCAPATPATVSTAMGVLAPEPDPGHQGGSTAALSAAWTSTPSKRVEPGLWTEVRALCSSMMSPKSAILTISMRAVMWQRFMNFSTVLLISARATSFSTSASTSTRRSHIVRQNLLDINTCASCTITMMRATLVRIVGSPPPLEGPTGTAPAVNRGDAINLKFSSSIAVTHTLIDTRPLGLPDDRRFCLAAAWRARLLKSPRAWPRTRLRPRAWTE